MHAYRHEALLYSGTDGFLAGTLSFIEDGVAADEPVLVAVNDAKIELLKSALDGHADRVGFIDITELGRNPACIIPAWREFVGEHASSGRAIRGIGEPIWPARTSDELVECEHHEALLNVAFDGDPDFWLLCPYDVTGLERGLVEVAHRTHPHVAAHGASRGSDSYRPPGARPLEDPLPEPVRTPDEIAFGKIEQLAAVRRFVAHHAGRAGLGEARKADLVAAANELATNSIRHGGGRGSLRMWREDGTVLCEVSDAGRIDEALVGCALPPPRIWSGRGLWLVNHLCDLVQIRSRPDGNVVRVQLRRG